MILIKDKELHTYILYYTFIKYFGQIYLSSLPCNSYPTPTYHFPLQSLT